MKPDPIHITVDPIEFESPQARLEAFKLTGSNVQMLKNQISLCLNDLVSLNMDATNPNDYFIKVARLRGEIAAYSYLINAHIEAHQEN